MTGVLKVDTIQKNDGTTPTAADLGLNITGTILQVVSTTKTDTFAESIGGNAQGTINAISVSITPKYSTSKILVVVHLSGASSYWSASNSAPSWAGRLVRNGSNIAIGDAAGSRNRQTFQLGGPSGSSPKLSQMSMTHLDLPSTTSTITYGVRLDNLDNGPQTMYLNYGPNDSDTNVLTARTVSSMTVMEIAG